MLKAELHIHTGSDPKDTYINYSNKEIIDEMKRRGYDVLAITCHNKYFDDKKTLEYAKHKGIILIEGIEKTIDKKHVLVYNAPKKEVEKAKTLDDLWEIKNKNKDVLIIAPHPYFIGSTCLKNEILRYKNLFDSYEISFFYTRGFDMNKKTVKLAKKLNKPLVGNCDIHNINFRGNVYTIINAKHNKKDIIDAIKKGKTKVVRKPLPLSEFSRIFKNKVLMTLTYHLNKTFRKLK